ncbi:flavin monoamine oxidase family protein [Occallatibacter savannae]|uniref:flavin monoamine oxidase family protein n=1 Tax=Occallatibacter savannae TaxID=1002691 RepID=UPI000D6879ED|nr:NAD(P)/FAD-dependent oxidoreductase [Occallatibacter savannae]
MAPIPVDFRTRAASNFQMETGRQRILVIGAGMAGLTAARRLAEAGRQVLVLEARDRVGGRIRTIREGDQILELGAEFIHGHPPELWDLIREAGLSTYPIDGTDYCHRDGKLRKCDEQSPIFKFLNQLEKWKGPDLAFADYPPLEKLSPEKREEVINYVQSFNAADYRQIGIHSLAVQQHAEDEIQGDEVFRIREGYDRLPQFLAWKAREAGARIELSRPVERIEWRRGRVEVYARDGGELLELTAGKVIIAVPLGVLHQFGVVFDPVPHALIAAHQLSMGPVRRFTLLFRDRWWAEHDDLKLSKLSFLFAHDAMPPVWWTAHPWETRTLTGWIGGPRSASFAQCTREQVGDIACQELARIFSLPIDYLRNQLVCCATQDWQTDPYAFGAYSYVPARGLDAVLELATPVENTLYFAGEHTDVTGHWGTVHAAIRSGERAAKQALIPTRAQLHQMTARPA